MARNVVGMHSQLAQHGERRNRHREKSRLRILGELQILFTALDAKPRNSELQRLVRGLENQPGRRIPFRERPSHANVL